MITFYLNVLFITLIFVIGLDVLHFWDNLSKIISGIITRGKVHKVFCEKPCGCSTCMSFWTNILYMFISGHFSILNVLIIIVLAMLTPELGGLILMFKSWLDALINKITIK
jgi:hypothetical protein